MLPQVSDPKLLVGISAADDAGVYQLDGQTALVQTVDVITPLVDDPYDFGRIAAANSLSDVYAMGGRPVTALNITGFPEQILELEIVADILRGAIDKAREAGCLIVGGHTLKDAELKFGLSVTGLVSPDKIVTNAGAVPGDKLILTKPLGMGILTTALKAGKLDAGVIKKITGIMAGLNKTACELMLQFGAHAATDVTGFGLLGHARGMARASGVGMMLQAGAIPYLPEALSMTRQGGYVSGGSQKNKEFLRNAVSFSENVDEHEQNIFFDAQTSGGLLISLPPAAAGQLLAALHENGIGDAALIGEITSREPGNIQVLS